MASKHQGQSTGVLGALIAAAWQTLPARADRETRRKVQADVMAEAQRPNLQRVGFITNLERK